MARDGDGGLAVQPDPPEVLERFHAELELVNIIASEVSRSVGPIVDFDDLVSAGREGLLQAARRYEPDRGVPFRAYANFRVRGAVLDGVRRMSIVPRPIYTRLAALEAASLISEGAAEFPDEDEDDDLEAALDEHLSTVATAAAISVVAGTLRAEAETRDHATDSTPENAVARAELLALVREALSGLLPAEAELVRRHYFEGEQFDHIARDLGMSKSWASRVHARAIARLTKRVAYSV